MSRANLAFRLNRFAVALIATFFAFGCPTLGDTVVLEPEKDTTIYSENNALGNGAGVSFHVGKTSGSTNDSGVVTDVRRALIAFEIENSGIPAGSTIDTVMLTLEANRTRAPSSDISLHRISSNWGEGTAASTSSGGGQGAIASTQDATWTFRFNNIVAAWNSAGGDFESTASAMTTVTGNGTYQWSSVQMGTDVQNWLDNSSSNFGWILAGDESNSSTAKRFSSREGSDPPRLSVDFTPAGGGKQDQTITFNAISDKTYGTQPFGVSATASSGLTVTFSVTSGSAVLSGSNVTLAGFGAVTIRASQAGNESFNPAPDVDQSFTVSAATSGAAALLTAGNAKLVNEGTFFDGNTYNGFELAGETGSFSSIAGEITRISFLDMDGDLMFAEYGSDDPNTILIITLEDFTAAVASPYNQPGTTYAQGHPSFVIENSTPLTFVSFFSLGNDTLRVDVSLINSGTFGGAVSGIAEIRSLTISDSSTAIGGINAANANFIGDSGIIGIDAENVEVGVFLFVGDMTPSGTAQPRLRVSAASMISEILINGGDLAETTGTFQIETNGVVYTFPITATDGQRSISDSPLRTDLGDGRLDPVSDTFAADIDAYFLTDGQTAAVNNP